MSIRRFDGNNWADISNVRRFDGDNWVDTKNVRRFDGTDWVDTIISKKFELFIAGYYPDRGSTLESLGNVLRWNFVDGPGAQHAVFAVDGDFVNPVVQLTLGTFSYYPTKDKLYISINGIPTTGNIVTMYASPLEINKSYSITVPGIFRALWLQVECNGYYRFSGSLSDVYVNGERHKFGN